MKTFILSALAATLVASPLLAAAPAEAQQRREVTTVRQNNNGRTVVTKKTVVRPNQYRNWRTGQRFDRRQAQNYRDYRLAAPPRGSQWVRSGRDALLVNGRGNVVQVRGGAFR